MADFTLEVKEKPNGMYIVSCADHDIVVQGKSLDEALGAFAWTISAHKAFEALGDISQKPAEIARIKR